jgi:multidrug resistance efflux pump
MAALLHYEAELRRWQSVPELVYYVANSTRDIVHYEQMFVMRHARIGESMHAIAASSLAAIDRNAPLIQALEATIGLLARDEWLAEAHDFAPSGLNPDVALIDYPFAAWRWVPLKDGAGLVFGGLVFARHETMREGEAVLAARLAETIAHAWCALTANVPVRRIKRVGKRERRALAAMLAVVALFPVQMSALAPVEVVATRPFVVAAPFAGVVQRVEVAPNSIVKAGQPVLTLDDTKARNELQVAGEKLQVARARVERSTSAAFASGDETRDITVNRAEQDLAQADYAYASDVLDRSRIVAPRAGVALYSDRRDWEGRAVATGDPIMQIVDPADVEFRIDLPIKEQLTLGKNSRVKVWLDADPLWSIDARLDTVSYQSRMTAAGVLSFAVTAKPAGARPRIGSRGTAKVYGSWAPLSFALLTRPIASFRQTLGL